MLTAFFLHAHIFKSSSLVSPMYPLFVFPQHPIRLPYEINRNHKGQYIRRREGVEQSVQAKENRQDHRQGNAEDDLSGQRNDCGRRRPAQRLQIDERPLVYHGQNHHTQVDTEAFHRKFRIIRALVRRSEDADELGREAFHNERCCQSNHCLRGQQIGKQFSSPVLPPCSNVVSHHRNTSCGGSHSHRDGDLEELHHDSQYSQRNLHVLRLPEDRVQSGVFHAHVLHRRHGDHQGNLGQKAGKAKGQKTFHQTSPDSQTAPLQFHSLHVKQIPHREDCGQDLPHDRGDCSSHHSHFQRIDKNRIQNQIRQCSEHCGKHSELGASVRADDGIHRLPEHIERDTQRNPEKVFVCARTGSFVHLPSEHGQDGIHENQVNRRHQDTDGNTQ